MLRTALFACMLPKSEADALNQESGRIYTDMLTRHYRLYRKQGVWLAPQNGERVEDALGGPTTLHSHSRDAAQQGFYKACKTAKACKKVGLETKYPYHRKRWRTTIWKSPKGLRLHAGTLLLGRARGLAPVAVALPSHLLTLPQAAFLEARLVWDRAARHYSWHLVVEDGTLPQMASGTNTAAIDLGEIHPAALTDGQETVILSCRALRANAQYTAKRLSEVSAKQARKQRGSRAFHRLQRRKSRFLAKQKRRARDMEHKISRAVVTWAKERQVRTLVIGDVRDVANGKRLNTIAQQKIGLWSHGRQRSYITYKAAAAGITVELVEEAYTSQTCPGSLPDGTGYLQCYKPKGRVFRCPACGFDFPSRWGRVCQPAFPALYRRAGACQTTSGKVSSRESDWASVAAWTRRIWLGGQRPGKGHPKKLRGFSPSGVSLASFRYLLGAFALGHLFLAGFPALTAKLAGALWAFLFLDVLPADLASYLAQRGRGLVGPLLFRVTARSLSRWCPGGVPPLPKCQCGNPVA